MFSKLHFLDRYVVNCSVISQPITLKEHFFGTPHHQQVRNGVRSSQWDQRSRGKGIYSDTRLVWISLQSVKTVTHDCCYRINAANFFKRAFLEDVPNEGVDNNKHHSHICLFCSYSHSWPAGSKYRDFLEKIWKGISIISQCVVRAKSTSNSPHEVSFGISPTMRPVKVVLQI